MEEKQKGFEKKVMVVIDESEHSYHALIWVLENLREPTTNLSFAIFATQPFPNCNHGSGQLGLGRLYYPFITSQKLITSMQQRIKKISLGLCGKAKIICTMRGVNVEALTVEGDPKEIICDQFYKHGIDLLVMANYPSNPSKRVFVENLSSYCLRNAKCPVLLVDKPAEPKSASKILVEPKMEENQKGSEKKVMVVIDESEHSYYALMWLLDNFNELFRKTSVTVFATQPFPNSLFRSAQLGFGHFHHPLVNNKYVLNSIQQRTKKISVALCEKAKSICAGRGVEVEAYTEAGDPKEIICDAVSKHGTDLLVMANYPSSPFKRFFVETLSEYCLKNAKCPVLLVEKPSDPKTVNSMY